MPALHPLRRSWGVLRSKKTQERECWTLCGSILRLRPGAPRLSGRGDVVLPLIARGHSPNGGELLSPTCRGTLALARVDVESASLLGLCQLKQPVHFEREGLSGPSQFEISTRVRARVLHRSPSQRTRGSSLRRVFRWPRCLECLGFRPNSEPGNPGFRV